MSLQNLKKIKYNRLLAVFITIKKATSRWPFYCASHALNKRDIPNATTHTKSLPRAWLPQHNYRSFWLLRIAQR